MNQKDSLQMDTSGGDFSLPGSISEGSVHFATARTLATGFMLQGSKKRILGGRIHPQPGCLLVTSPPRQPANRQWAKRKVSELLPC